MNLLSLHDFAELGLGDTVYLRAACEEAGAIAIHAADGTCLGVVEDLSTAIAAIANQEFQVATLH